MRKKGDELYLNITVVYIYTTVNIHTYAADKSLQSCPTLCDPKEGSPPGSSVHGILQAKTLEWVAISFSKRNYRKKESEVAQLCPTLCNPMQCSPPGSSVHGILQAKTLECLPRPSPGGLPDPGIEWGLPHCRKILYRLSHPVGLRLPCVCVLVAQSCPTPCNPIDGSPPGPSAHGILQVRTLEWVAVSFSKRNYRKKESEVAQSCPTPCDPMD